MRMQFGLSSFVRAEGDLPELPVINMYAEAAPTEETGVVLQSRKGLDDRSANMGAGPVDTLFQRDGVLSGALFGISANTLYQATTSRGAVVGAGPWSIAGYELALFAAGGSSLYYWNGAALATVSFPDSASVSKVAVGASRLLCIRADTQKFYWSDSLATDIDALDFASAESQPDKLRDILFIDDTAILFGAETVEFWPNTGDADLPFQPLEGRVFEKGIRATGCATIFGTTFAWVTDHNEVCLGDADAVISPRRGWKPRLSPRPYADCLPFSSKARSFSASASIRGPGLTARATSCGASSRPTARTTGRRSALLAGCSARLWTARPWPLDQITQTTERFWNAGSGVVSP